MNSTITYLELLNLESDEKPIAMDYLVYEDDKMYNAEYYSLLEVLKLSYANVKPMSTISCNLSSVEDALWKSKYLYKHRVKQFPPNLIYLTYLIFLLCLLWSVVMATLSYFLFKIFREKNKLEGYLIVIACCLFCVCLQMFAHLSFERKDIPKKRARGIVGIFAIFLMMVVMEVFLYALGISPIVNFQRLKEY